MSEQRSAAALEESRRRLGIPANYEWSECAGGCGDVAWHQPMDELKAKGVPFIISCSSACAMKALTSAL